ncbi:hypothetical protein [Pseudomonas syringae group genomosp. 7]|uniref:hypothetical protein n=1 Tax=Pseudomonas syringae group genomosp. 7 TaxID=251699 RepID=UPI0037702F90
MSWCLLRRCCGVFFWLWLWLCCVFFFCVVCGLGGWGGGGCFGVHVWRVSVGLGAVGVG